MSVAFYEGKALDECLAAGDDHLARRFFARVSDIVADPWALMIRADFRHPQVEGRRPAGFGLICRYIQGVCRAAQKDEVLLKRFFEAVSLLGPLASLMAPEIVWRVLLRGRR
jgi:hypothetical protein